MRQPVVVVAEDDDSVRALLRLELEKRGYAVHACENGRQALDLVRQLDPDAVIMDRMMPVMDGNAVLAQIRADPETADIAVIMVTARTDLDAINESFDRGADDYITKPFHADAVDAALRALLGTR